MNKIEIIQETLMELFIKSTTGGGDQGEGKKNEGRSASVASPTGAELAPAPRPKRGILKKH